LPVIVKKTAVVALAPAVVMPSPKVDMSLINNLEKVNTGLNALNLQNKAALEKKEKEILELKKQIVRLIPQAEVSNKKVNASNTSLNIVKQQLNGKTVELATLQAEFDRLKGLYQTAQQNNQVPILDNSIIVLRNEIAQSRKEYDELNTNYQSLEKDLKRALAENVTQSQHIVTLTNQLSQKSSELENLFTANTLEIHNLKESMGSKQKQIELLQNTIHQNTILAQTEAITSKSRCRLVETELEKVKTENGQLEAQRAQMAIMLASEQAECVIANRALKASEEKVKQLQKDLREKQTAINKQEFENQELQLKYQEKYVARETELLARCETIMQQLEHSTSAMDVSAEIDLQVQRHKNEIIQINQRYAFEMESMSIDYKKVRDEADRSKERIATLELQLQGMATDMAQKKADFEAYTKRMSNALNDSNGQDTPQYIELMNKLKQTQKDYLEYRQNNANVAKQIQQEIGSKQNDIKNANDNIQFLKNKIKTMEDEKQQFIVKHEEEMRTQQLFYKKAYDQLSTETQTKLTNATNRIYILEAEVRNKEKTYQEKADQIATEYNAKIATLESQSAQKEQEFMNQAQQALTAQSKIQEQADEASRLISELEQQKIKVTQDAESRMNLLTQEQDQKIRTLYQEIENLKTTKHAILQTEHEQYQSKLDSLNEEMERNSTSLNAKISELNTLYMESQSKNQALQRQVDQLQETSKVTINNSEYYAQKLEELNLEKSSLSQAVEKFNENVEIANSERSKLIASLAILSENQAKLNTDIMAFQAEKEEFLTKQEAFQSKESTFAFDVEKRVEEGIKKRLEEDVKRALNQERANIDIQKQQLNETMEEDRKVKKRAREEMQINLGKGDEPSRKRVKLDSIQIREAGQAVMNQVRKVQVTKRMAQLRAQEVVAVMELDEMETDQKQNQNAFIDASNPDLRGILDRVSNNVPLTKRANKQALKKPKPVDIPVTKVTRANKVAQEILDAVKNDRIY